MSEGYVSTIMGRSRILKNAQIDMICSRERRRPTSLERRAVGHSLRAAINTPIQGSAADVVMMAMIVLNESEVLRNLGWRMLLQIHDEVILEGPKDTRDEALAEVRRCMENPFDGVGLSELRVSLDVDAKSADSWYQAK
jgi:DNA polymerase-1